jgi:hypothetical protein
MFKSLSYNSPQIYTSENPGISMPFVYAFDFFLSQHFKPVFDEYSLKNDLKG